MARRRLCPEDAPLTPLAAALAATAAGVSALVLAASPATGSASASSGGSVTATDSPAASSAAGRSESAVPSDTPTATIGPSPSPSATSSELPGRSQVQVINVASSDPGRTSRSIYVYRPAGPDSPTLPVLYLLHGQFGSPNDPFSAGLRATLDQLFASGVAPFVVAVPDGISTVRGDDEWGDADDGADQLETFVTRDAIDAVEGPLRRDRAHRAIAGFSMGGYGAAVNAARRAQLFGQLVSLGGYFHLDDPEHVFGTNRTVRYVHTPLLRTSMYDHTRVFLLDSSQEHDPVITGELDRMRAALAARHHPPGAVVTPGTHSWAWVNNQWPVVSRFLSQGWGRSV